MAPRGGAIEDRNGVLLGIKYEAARISGVDEATLATIKEQITREVGEGWRSDEQILRGRNAVRREHGLPGLGVPVERPFPDRGMQRPLWRRIFGR
jgi:hypothetical protein